MQDVGKGFNRVEHYARIIDRVHAHGISVQAGIVFGFDHDTPAIFKATVDFLEEAGVQNATFNILTPYPGTPLFQRLDAQGRILTRDWRKVQRTHRRSVSAQANERGRTSGWISVCKPAFLFSLQYDQTAVAFACPDMVDPALEPGICSLLGQHAMGRLAKRWGTADVGLSHPSRLVLPRANPDINCRK